MKIILVIPTLKQGGAERVISELANEWAKRGYITHFVLLAKSERFYAINSNIIVHELGFENKGIVQKGIAEIRTLVRLRNLLKKEKPDFVLSFMEKYNVLTILASLFLNLNVFVSDRSNPKKKVPFFVSFLRKRFYKYATGIIAQTNLAKDILLEKTCHTNIKVIPNPLKHIEVNSAIPKEKVIINIGRLVPEKGQSYLIDAFAQITDKSWRLVILGEGPLRTQLHEQACRLKIIDRVLMPGSVNNVEEWLQRSSVFAFPSVSEGFPNALVEAMALGLPCVSFDCDAGPRDILEDGVNGILIPACDTEKLADKLNLLINDENLRNELGANATSITQKLAVSKISEDFFCFCNSYKYSYK
jgi:GalNAc-alpha-(1->4)-GalNAc-alpha-(1->3)-diNAcBac-PP-undecaprenol alpha-1,4-N-acetyl-D-galactosaminyltransferase